MDFNQIYLKLLEENDENSYLQRELLAKRIKEIDQRSRDRITARIEKKRKEANEIQKGAEKRRKDAERNRQKQSNIAKALSVLQGI